MPKVKVLFLAANPSGTNPLNLQEEIRQITTKVGASKHRNSLDLISGWAVRPDDVMQALLEHKPHVVHFSGHGSSAAELILLDDRGDPKPVSQAALTSLFGVLKDNVRVVVLNACYSRQQAAALTRIIDCAVGMSRPIGDKAAIIFAASFYRALGFGRSAKEAFDLGKASLEMEGIPESQTPDLLVRDGVNSSNIYLIGQRKPKREISHRINENEFAPGFSEEKDDVASESSSNPSSGADNGNIQTEVDTDLALIELKINADFSKFSDAQQDKLLSLIKQMLNMDGGIRVVKKRPGCVQLTLALSHEKAEELYWLVKAGVLDSLGVTDVVLLDEGDKSHLWQPQQMRPRRLVDGPIIGFVRFATLRNQDAEAVLDRDGRWHCAQLPVLDRVLNGIFGPSNDLNEGLFGHSELRRVAAWLGGSVHFSNKNTGEDIDETIS